MLNMVPFKYGFILFGLMLPNRVDLNQYLSQLNAPLDDRAIFGGGEDILTLRIDADAGQWEPMGSGGLLFKLHDVNWRIGESNEDKFCKTTPPAQGSRPSGAGHVRRPTLGARNTLRPVCRTIGLWGSD